MCTHPRSLKYVNFCIVSTSSHNFSSCTTASPIFPSHFLHLKFLENFGDTHFTPPHLSWIHLPHSTELTLTLKLQTPHGSTLLLDKSPCVMPPLTIILIFQTLTLKNFLAKAFFHSKNLSLCPSIVSLMTAKSSAYNNSPSAPSLANSVTTSTTNA